LAYHLGFALAKGSLSLTIDLGMAGVFNPYISIGDVAMVECNIFADYSIDYNENFESLFTLLLGRADSFPFSNGRLTCPYL